MYRLFYIGRDIDFELDLTQANTVRMELGGTFAPIYLSDMRSRHGFEPSVKARYESVRLDQQICRLTFPRERLEEFLRSVTGWTIQIFPRLQNVKEGRLPGHNLGEAEVMLWEKKNTDGKLARVTLQFKIAKDPSKKWVAASGKSSDSFSFLCAS